MRVLRRKSNVSTRRTSWRARSLVANSRWIWRYAGESSGSASKASTKASGGSSGAPKKRRRRRGGTRADQAVELITSQPGISASDVAKTMKIKPNYLYRVLGDLEKEGRVKKDGRNYFPAS